MFIEIPLSVLFSIKTKVLVFLLSSFYKHRKTIKNVLKNEFQFNFDPTNWPLSALYAPATLLSCLVTNHDNFIILMDVFFPLLALNLGTCGIYLKRTVNTSPEQMRLDLNLMYTTGLAEANEFSRAFSSRPIQ